MFALLADKFMVFWHKKTTNDKLKSGRDRYMSLVYWLETPLFREPIDDVLTDEAKRKAVAFWAHARGDLQEIVDIFRKESRKITEKKLEEKCTDKGCRCKEKLC